MSRIERISRMICKTWLKPDPKLEPGFTDQRWPLFREEAEAVMAFMVREGIEPPTEPMSK